MYDHSPRPPEPSAAPPIRSHCRYRGRTQCRVNRNGHRALRRGSLAGLLHAPMILPGDAVGLICWSAVTELCALRPLSACDELALQPWSDQMAQHLTTMIKE